MKVSAIAPLLQTHGVRLIGIGFEPNGWEDFMEQKFFAGELYLDTPRSTYAALGMKHMNLIQLGAFVMRPNFWRVFLGRDGISHDLRGDSFQNGGCLIVTRGGKRVLWAYRERKPFCSFHNKNITSALGIEYEEQDEERK